MSDEHGPMWSSAYGHPFVQTPNMERIAESGATFDAAYCNSPLCVPSRLSFMTGRYVSRCEGWDNAKPLPSDVPTWPYLLRSVGYDTALSGKMHLIGQDQLHGFRQQLAYDPHGGGHRPDANRLRQAFNFSGYTEDEIHTARSATCSAIHSSLPRSGTPFPTLIS